MKLISRRKPNRSSEQSLAIVSEHGYATTGAYSKRSSTLMLGLLANLQLKISIKLRAMIFNSGLNRVQNILSTAWKSKIQCA